MMQIVRDEFRCPHMAKYGTLDDALQILRNLTSPAPQARHELYHQRGASASLPQRLPAANLDGRPRAMAPHHRRDEPGAPPASGRERAREADGAASASATGHERYKRDAYASPYAASAPIIKRS